MTKDALRERQLTSELLSALEPSEAIDSDASFRRGRWRRWVVRGLVVLVILGLGAAGFAFAKRAGTFDSGTAGSMLTHRVQRGELLVTITEDGNLESASNVDIKCEVAGGSTILWIVEDGKEVEAGEKLAELDSSQLEDQINQQKITYEKAQAAYIQAEKDYNVAKISVQEYLEGTYRKELQDLEADITIALESLRSAENSLLHTERMFRKGYVSSLQLEAQQFAVERAKIELDSARTAKDVLERFTKAKTLEDLQSKRDTAEAKMKSEKAAFELEEARLKRLEAQLQKCVIHASQSGMAVYANETGFGRFGSQQPQIEEGAMVRERQNIFRLPDLSQMQVKVAVHESKVDQLRPGMRTRVRILDQEYQGIVDSIANQPEATHFFLGNVKEYATIVKLPETNKGEGLSKPSDRFMLKPGMTAEVEILVAHLKDVLTLPVAAVVEQRGKFFCWVKKGEQTERRLLVLGLSNDEFVEVKDGIIEGEEVILNPRAVVAEARQQEQQPETVDVEKKFGASAPGEEAVPDKQRDFTPGGRAPAEKAPGAPPTATPGIPGPPGASAPGQAPGARGPDRRPGGGPPDFKDLDKDGDGKISRDEVPGQMGAFFDRLDGNGDGFIDSTEINEMKKRFSQGGGHPGGGPPPAGGPAPVGGPPPGGSPP